jgi:hypothetical protein
MRIFTLFLFFAFQVIVVKAEVTRKTIKELPDTGQNTSYTNVPGEDADYSINYTG